MKHERIIVGFKDEFREKRRGWKVSDWLIISYTYVDADTFSVFRRDGKKIIDFTFKDADDAYEFADWINKIYGEYFPIWYDYPDADIFALCKWSVKNGLNIFDVVNQLKNQNKVEKHDLSAAFKKSMDNIKEWLNGQKHRGITAA